MNGLRHGHISHYGYRIVWIPELKKQVREHKYLMEQHLGRALDKSEVVHHINGNKLDNQLENLIVVTRAEHKRIHNDIGMDTRFKNIYNISDKAFYEIYFKYQSSRKAAVELGCNYKTVERAVRRFTGKKLREIAIINNWKLGGERI